MIRKNLKKPRSIEKGIGSGNLPAGAVKINGVNIKI
jgi:hypothetical protein